MSTIQIIGFVLLLVGIVLLGIEFYLPGVGVPGICGSICTIVGVILAGRNMRGILIVGVIAVVIIAVLLVISLIILNSQKAHTPIVLETDLNGKDLFIGGDDMEYLIGKKGKAATDLKPSGKGEFDGVLLEVLSRGEFIAKGAALEIEEIKNNRIVVKEEKKWNH